MISSLLIANRGEIARRILRTARALGVRTIAVYSEADAAMPFVREADEAVCIGPAPARESYLDQAKILAAAAETGAEAIHPGYGFLSENAEFAEAVEAAGLVWVGAPPAAIRAMGRKDAAKALMIAAGVPVTPGYMGPDQSLERLSAEAETIGWPVLIKAVSGGGGKGMRRVEAAGEFADALASCRREAASAFGDDRVLLEKYVLNPRHIEVQVFGDRHGNYVHLFERDCSLQRRHQKVIEEAPAPGMDVATREAVCAAAVRTARAVDYVGAGTIEFIADASDGLRADRIWFMEMNTRLQVEHPVTEAITGVDLVEWQLRVAAGEVLPRRQAELSIGGHAIEARFYAEDPETGFLPSPGRIEHLHFDPGARVDSGVMRGDTISTFYDPMIAKVITHGATRDGARRALMQWLDRSFVGPRPTNQGFLHACLSLEAFVDGTVDTGLIARHGDALSQRLPPSPQVLAAAAAGLRRNLLADTTAVGLAGFRLNAPSDLGVRLYERGRAHWVDDPPPAALIAHNAGDGVVVVVERGQPHFFTIRPPPVTASGAASSGAVLAPMPGQITAVAVREGDAVTTGQKLLTLEAMKMEHTLTAPFDGIVTRLAASVGAQVEHEALLAEVSPAQDA